MENSKNVFQFVIGITESEDLDAIIEIAELVLCFVPGGVAITKVIKVLKFVKKSQPLVCKTTKLTESLVNKGNSKREDFKRTFNFAISGGSLSPEEQEFLRPRAIQAGYTEDEFQLMVIKNKLI